MVKMTQKFFMAAMSAVFFTLLSVNAFSEEFNPVTAAPVTDNNQNVSSTMRYIKWNADGTLKSELISIKKDTSQVFRFERPIIRAAISNPAICDITTAGDKDILINAREAGVVNLIVWDQNDNVATYGIDVTLDIKKLDNILRNIDPKADLKIIPFNKTTAIYGTTETSVKLKQMSDAAKAFDANSLMYVKIRDPKQVLLEVRFAEVKRVGAKDFRLDVQALFDGFIDPDTFYNITSFTGQVGTALDGTLKGAGARSGALASDNSEAVIGNNSQSIGNLGMRVYSNRGAYIFPLLKWLESKNLLKIIARPNLIAKDGEESHFLVGGEFPVPTTTTNGVNIEYKEFGNDLKFTPEILDDEIIRLKIKASISELDFSTTVTSGGATVPATLKKEYSSVSELRDNETLVIGGFMSQKVNKVVRKMPLLGDVPILSTLFKSEEYSRTDNELIVVITPHIVRPLALGEKKVFFNEKSVKEAVRQFSPSYSDPTGDTISNMFNQEEPRREFAKDGATDVDKFQRSVALKMDKNNAQPKHDYNFFAPKPKPAAESASKPKPAAASKPVSKPKPVASAAKPEVKKAAVSKPKPAVSDEPVFAAFDSAKNKPLASSGNKGSFKGGYIQQN